MFDLFMNLLWVPFYDFAWAPDNSFLYVKDKVHKLNFVSLFGLYVGIFTHHKDLPVSLLSGQCSPKKLLEMYFAISENLYFSYNI